MARCARQARPASPEIDKSWRSGVLSCCEDKRLAAARVLSGLSASPASCTHMQCPATRSPLAASRGPGECGRPDVPDAGGHALPPAPGHRHAAELGDVGQLPAERGGVRQLPAQPERARHGRRERQRQGAAAGSPSCLCMPRPGGWARRGAPAARRVLWGSIWSG